MTNNEKEFRNQFISDFGSYMRDCALTPKQACSYSKAVDALAASYRPLPNFWRQLHTGLVEEAVKAYMLQDPVEILADPSEYAEWKQDVANHLFMHQHDELNAELLAQIPLADRPTDEWAATEWICAELERRGDIENLEYAECDGHKCGRAALRALETS
ncbi:hypothetical protein ACTMU2_18140 [Cupriavidus basilensis]